MSFIHHTRLVRFPGIILPWLEMQRKLWWGASRVDRTFDAIADAETVIGGVAELITEAKVDVYSIPGLMNMLSTPDGEAKVLKRVQYANLIKSNWQAIIKDANEEYDQKQNAIVQGMGGLIEQYLAIISAASGIPVTKLMGTSAKGLSATGEGDLRNFYDMISARQENYLRPRFNQFDEVFLRSATGQAPSDMPWEFGKLWQMDEAQEAEIENKRSATDTAYLNAGVIDEVVVAKQLKARGTYVAIDDEYIEELADLVEDKDDDPPPIIPGDPADPRADPTPRDAAGNPIPQDEPPDDE